jgi:CheY-like chemotaxis protein/signal transduction histidine kinase
MRADGVAETLRRGATAARGVFARCIRETGDDRHRIHSGGAGPSAQPKARLLDASVAFMERRLRRDVFVPKVLGAQVALAAVLVHVMRGGLDFLVAASEDDQGAAHSAWSWSPSARDSTARTRALAPGPGPVVEILPALGFAFVAAATLRARGSRLLHAWRIAQLVLAAIAIAYAHAVCVAARSVPELASFLSARDAGAENAAAETSAALAFSARAFAGIVGPTLFADASRLAAGLMPRGVTCLCGLVASCNLELHTSHVQAVGSAAVIAGAYSAWILSRCDAHGLAGRWRAFVCLGGVLAASTLTLSRRYELALERYTRIAAIQEDADRLREARTDTKRFMAFLFHEIRVPLSVISLGIPSLRDHIDAAAVARLNPRDAGEPIALDETETEMAIETADLMGRSMDVVQRVLGDVLDLLHNSTDDERAALRPEWTDLKSLVNTALTASGPMFERGGASLSQGVPQDVARRLSRVAMLVDPPRLRRALDAVLASASGITPPGGVTQVTVNVTPMEPPVEGSVAATAAATFHPKPSKNSEKYEWVSVDVVLLCRQRAERVDSPRADEFAAWLRSTQGAEVGTDEQQSGRAGGGENARCTTANELLRMLREPLHRAAGGARRAARWSMCDSDAIRSDERAAEEAFLGDADSKDRVFAPAAAALDLHVARMLAELHGGEILVRQVPSSTPSESGGTAIIIRVPALTRPMDNLMLERAQGAGEVTAAAGPWNNPFATRIPDSPAAMTRSRPPSRPLSRMATANRESLPGVGAAALQRGRLHKENTREMLRLSRDRLLEAQTGDWGARAAAEAEAEAGPSRETAPSLVAAVAETAAAAVASEQRRRAAALGAGGALSAEMLNAALPRANASRSGPGTFMNINNRSFRYEQDVPAPAAAVTAAPAATVAAAKGKSPLRQGGSPPALESAETSDGSGKRSREASDPGESDSPDGLLLTKSPEKPDATGPGPAANAEAHRKDRPRVLVVEDSVPTRTMLARLLRRLDLDVTEVGDGLQAVRACAAAATAEHGSQSAPFDLVLMDKEMPVMDGHEATLQLRRNGVRSPIVGVTANVLESDREKFVQKGLSDFLHKPVSRGDLVRVLQKHGLCGCDPFRAADRPRRSAEEAKKSRKTPEPELSSPEPSLGATPRATRRATRGGGG